MGAVRCGHWPKPCATAAVQVPLPVPHWRHERAVRQAVNGGPLLHASHSIHFWLAMWPLHASGRKTVWQLARLEADSWKAFLAQALRAPLLLTCHHPCPACLPCLVQSELRARQGVCSGGCGVCVLLIIMFVCCRGCCQHLPLLPGAGTCSTYHCYKGGPDEPPEGQETGGCPVYSHPAQVL